MNTGFNLGPLPIHYYGVIITVGIAAAGLLTFYRVRREKVAGDVLVDALPWIFLGGLLGARLWHIFTPSDSLVRLGISTRYYLTHLHEAVAIWKGGVGIMGAILGGVTALGIYCRIHQQPLLLWLDVLAPGVALGQAIGRWGNYVNQEVYGIPSTLPWAIYIDPGHRLPAYQQVATYHPLFLYESLWSLLNMGFLLWLGTRYRDQLNPGSLFWVYLLIYGAGRAGLEFLRLDPSTIAGVNINQTAAAAAALFAGWMLLRQQQLLDKC